MESEKKRGKYEQKMEHQQENMNKITEKAKNNKTKTSSKKKGNETKKKNVHEKQNYRDEVGSTNLSNIRKQLNRHNP